VQGFCRFPCFAPRRGGVKAPDRTARARRLAARIRTSLFL
jgi:hypothetical protein